jgi:hypothetical protein
MNNNISGRRKKDKEKKDFSSVDIKVPKVEKTKADVMDASADIIDIDNTPDVATWNKEIHIKADAAAAGITDNKLQETEILLPPTTISIGLKEKKGPKKDLIIDPADGKEVDEAIKSGSTLTDEANLS